MIRLVTFDLDNTLWPVDEVISRAVAAQDAWLAREAPEYVQLDQADLAELRHDVLEGEPGLIHDLSRMREAVLERALRHCGHPAPEAARLAAGAFAEFIDWRHRVDFFPAALPVLAELAKRYTLAALTNGNADFRRLGLAQYFSFGYSAADVGASKPAPAMFRRALEHAAVVAAEAVHVGDNPVDDIQGASQVGMATIWVNLARRTDETEASAEVTRLEDVPAAIASLDGSPPASATSDGNA